MDRFYQHLFDPRAEFVKCVIWGIREKALSEVMTPEEKDDWDKCQLQEFLTLLKSVFKKADEQAGGDNCIHYNTLGNVVKRCWIEWRKGGEERTTNVGVEMLMKNHCPHEHQD